MNCIHHYILIGKGKVTARCKHCGDTRSWEEPKIDEIHNPWIFYRGNDLEEWLDSMAVAGIKKGLS